jgi:Domain of unknown function (DUF4129)
VKRLLRTLLLLLPLLPAVLRADAATLTLEQYSSRLERMQALVSAGQLDTARAEGRTLLNKEVLAPGGERFHTDGTLLAAVERLKKGGELSVQRRLETAVGELRRTAPAGSSAQPADRKLLEKLREQEQVDDPLKGGKVAMPKAPDLAWSDRMLKAFRTVWKWIADHFVKLLEWLERFWPKSPAKKQAGSIGMRLIVGSVVGLILLSLGVLAYEVIRRSRRSAAAGKVESVPAASTRDDDPLSRAASEWELYAERLAAAGRIREAIRAWYHAVLVTLCTGGILQFRKGRTNWEYVAAVHPQRAWRADFIQLTRRFEQEWYGVHESSRDALDECRDWARSILEAALREKGAA